jgi:hypothetical protein
MCDRLARVRALREYRAGMATRPLVPRLGHQPYHPDALLGFPLRPPHDIGYDDGRGG